MAGVPCLSGGLGTFIALTGVRCHLSQQEIRRHEFNYFVDQPPSIAQGGRGVTVPGCPACRKRINTMSQFLDHLADDVLPALIEKLSVDANPE